MFCRMQLAIVYGIALVALRESMGQARVWEAQFLIYSWLSEHLLHKEYDSVKLLYMSKVNQNHFPDEKEPILAAAGISAKLKLFDSLTEGSWLRISIL